jgi:HSP20 family protein
MSLTPYRPFPLSYMLSRLYDAGLAPSRADAPMQLPVDVVATENEYIIHAVVPGLKPEDVNIEIKDQILTIQGETVVPEYDKERQYLLDEILYGKFARTLALDADLDGSKAEAKVENGMLTLRIPRAEKAKPKVVKVTAH